MTPYQPEQVEPELLGVNEVALYLHLHPMTIYRLVRRQGGLPMAKIGGQWRIYKDSLEAWVRNQEVTKVQS